MVTMLFRVGKLHNSRVFSKGAHSALVVRSSCFIRKEESHKCSKCQLAPSTTAVYLKI